MQDMRGKVLIEQLLSHCIFKCVLNPQNNVLQADAEVVSLHCAKRML